MIARASRAAVVLLSIAGALGTACSSADVVTAPPEAPSANEAGATTTPDIEWKTCDLTPGSKQGGAECALVPVLRDHADPSGPTIDVAVKRVVSQPRTKTQLWVVEGGPGGSALTSLQNIARHVLDLRPEIAVYALDHRGVGGSHPLECSAQQTGVSLGGKAIIEEEWPPCVATLVANESAILPHLTTSDSMRDLAAMIDRTRIADVPVILHGVSYGTCALARFMRLFPDKVDGIVLEGIAPPGESLETYDAEMNATARRLFDACALEPKCRARFTDEPWKVAGDVVASFDVGHCPELGLDADGARMFLGSYLSFATRTADARSSSSSSMTPTQRSIRAAPATSRL